jgi:hypothetical protein
MVFSDCARNGNCWGVLLEKLWSKINVNYERTCGGWQHEVLRVFLGCGAKDYLMKYLTVEELWKVMVEANERGHILGCGTKGGGDDTQS